MFSSSWFSFLYFLVANSFIATQELQIIVIHIIMNAKEKINAARPAEPTMAPINAAVINAPVVTLEIYFDFANLAARVFSCTPRPLIQF